MASFYHKVHFYQLNFCSFIALKSSIRNGSLYKKASILVSGSPIGFTDYTEKNPASEVVFLSGKTLGYLTEKIFENESGQSIMLGLFVLSLGFASLYFHGMTARTVRKMQILHASKFGQIGIPYYTARVIPPNPLLKTRKPR